MYGILGAVEEKITEDSILKSSYIILKEHNKIKIKIEVV